VPKNTGRGKIASAWHGFLETVYRFFFEPIRLFADLPVYDPKGWPEGLRGMNCLIDSRPYRRSFRRGEIRRKKNGGFNLVATVIFSDYYFCNHPCAHFGPPSPPVSSETQDSGQGGRYLFQPATVGDCAIITWGVKVCQGAGGFVAVFSSYLF